MGLFASLTKTAGSFLQWQRATPAESSGFARGQRLKPNAAIPAKEPKPGLAPQTVEDLDNKIPAIPWRVLFVGGDLGWFHQIQRDMVCLEPDWTCTRVENGVQARSARAFGPFDALILDGHMTDAADFLEAPEVAAGRSICLMRRNVLERSATSPWNHPKVASVTVECGAAGLVAALKRAARLRDWMSNPAIKRLLPSLRKLPTAPKLHTQITEEMQSPNGSLNVVASLVAQDPVMSAKVLQVANSAFFGMTHEVTDTAEAVMVLGTERIRSLILLAEVFSQYSGAQCPSFSPEHIWNHSVQVGTFARAITLAETRNGRTAEAAFTAGLLHDIGKLVLAGNLPEMYEAGCRLQAGRQTSHYKAELEIMGTTHAELGACLLATWGLPLPILEAIAWHHEPDRSTDRSFSLLAAVHTANVFAQEKNPGSENTDARDRIHGGYLLRIGMGNCLNRWREFCGLTLPPEVTMEEQLRLRREAKEN